MAKPKEGTQLEPEQTQAPDWLDQLVDEIYAKMEDGERPALSFLLERLLDKVMERERQRFLASHEGEQANGFYHRRLHLTLGRLNLKVPGSATPNPSAPRSSPHAGSG